ncbi:MAG TPA: hypothetical protein VN408_36385, partial [Actinoplanes sp.]|nr:hypothetical protein [Actinoplanes sp.]
AVHGFADRVATAAAHPVRIVPTPRWATTVAATRATDTARQSLTALSQDIAETARRIRAVASDYEAADARAAARLRATR